MDHREIDYTFMKTGQVSTNNEVDKDTLLDIMTLITTFSQNSIVSADIYVKHANRKVITTKDIQMAMKLEVFEFVNRDNTKLLQKNRKEIEEDYYNHEEDEFDYDKAIDNLIDNEYTNERYCKSTCECDICHKMNHIDKTWDYWEPKTNLEKILKIHISKIV